MVAQNVGGSERFVLSSLTREYRLSLLLLLAGIAMVAALATFTVWANATGNYPTSFWPGLTIDLIGTAGGMLILLAGTVAYYHRAFLRETQRSN
jgi:hypothetical protein